MSPAFALPAGALGAAAVVLVALAVWVAAPRRQLDARMQPAMVVAVALSLAAAYVGVGPWLWLLVPGALWPLRAGLPATDRRGRAALSALIAVSGVLLAAATLCRLLGESVAPLASVLLLLGLL